MCYVNLLVLEKVPRHIYCTGNLVDTHWKLQSKPACYHSGTICKWASKTQISLQTYQYMLLENINTKWINKIKDILVQCSKTYYWTHQPLHTHILYFVFYLFYIIFALFLNLQLV